MVEEKKADYVFTVKDNQPTLLQAIRDLDDSAAPATGPTPASGVPPPADAPPHRRSPPGRRGHGPPELAHVEVVVEPPLRQEFPVAPALNDATGARHV